MQKRPIQGHRSRPQLALRYRPPRERPPRKPREPRRPGDRYYASDDDDGLAQNAGCVITSLIVDAACLAGGCCSLRLLALLLPAWGLWAWLR